MINGRNAMEITTERAREIARGYISAATGDAEMTRFATMGQADGYALLQSIEYSAETIGKSDQYTDAERATIAGELDYLRAWVREYHGRYAVTEYTTEYAEWQEGDDEPKKLDETEKTLMFDTFRDVVKYLRQEGISRDAMPDNGPYTLNTWAFATYDNPTSGREEKTFHPAHGLTDRGWNAILRAALAR